MGTQVQSLPGSEQVWGSRQGSWVLEGLPTPLPQDPGRTGPGTGAQEATEDVPAGPVLWAGRPAPGGRAGSPGPPAARRPPTSAWLWHR